MHDYFDELTRLRILEEYAHVYAFQEEGAYWWEKYCSRKKELEQYFGVTIKDTNW